MFNPEYRQPFIPLSWNYKEIARLNEVIFDQTGKQLYVRLGKDKYEPLIKANKPFTPAGSTDPSSGGTETEGDMGLVPAPKKGDENKVLIGNGTWISIEELAKIIGSFKGSSASSTGNSGFVPTPPAGSQNKVLTGAGTWKDITDIGNTFIGGTSSNIGSKGLVPPPPINGSNYFLSGDGTWKTPDSITPVFSSPTPSSPGKNGLVPGATVAQVNYVLTGNGTWTSPSVFTSYLSTFVGCTSSAFGKQGLVPSPPAGSQNKVLKGDGTWGDMGGSSISSTAPSNKNSLWVDSNGNLKYFNTSTNSWKLVQAEAVWA